MVQGIVFFYWVLVFEPINYLDCSFVTARIFSALYSEVVQTCSFGHFTLIYKCEKRWPYFSEVVTYFSSRSKSFQIGAHFNTGSRVLYFVVWVNFCCRLFSFFLIYHKWDKQRSQKSHDVHLSQLYPQCHDHHLHQLENYF